MEASRLALISGDQSSYTRSIRIMGDIYRKKMDIDVSIFFMNCITVAIVSVFVGL